MILEKVCLLVLILVNCSEGWRATGKACETMAGIEYGVTQPCTEELFRKAKKTAKRGPKGLLCTCTGTAVSYFLSVEDPGLRKPENCEWDEDTQKYLKTGVPTTCTSFIISQYKEEDYPNPEEYLCTCIKGKAEPASCWTMPNGKEKCDTKYTGGRMDIKRDWSVNNPMGKEAENFNKGRKKGSENRMGPGETPGHDYSCLATVEGIELSEEELRGDLVPCGKSEKFRDEIFDGKMSVENYECFWNCNEKAEVIFGYQVKVENRMMMIKTGKDEGSSNNRKLGGDAADSCITLDDGTEIKSDVQIPCTQEILRNFGDQQAFEDGMMCTCSRDGNQYSMSIQHKGIMSEGTDLKEFDDENAAKKGEDCMPFGEGAMMKVDEPVPCTPEIFRAFNMPAEKDKEGLVCSCKKNGNKFGLSMSGSMPSGSGNRMEPGEAPENDLSTRETTDGEEECVLPDEEDGMPVGEPVQCTANIFRAFGLVGEDAPDPSSSLCSCFKDGPLKYQLQMNSKYSVGISTDEKFCIFTEDFSTIPTGEEVECNNVILRAFTGQKENDATGLKCTCTKNQNGNAFLSYTSS
ncbi:uncharacterized protein LOC111711408 isoform X3 [Eurytemora carolleeae]|uniref:uncharacterized protein LOC111711408 isoform X3 n=1 Tax=Eurytemora carolleeae TaxID=1294199 RepID=UPI000C795357|nr:uncharacterized protein LOC111711408 isoform X3 [Eurytemora carolleeae]|eukprot:XP_023341528.1 uncharacterized protein LOC111711408 isoform X3 [Eurytemora affinis]